MHGHEDVLGGIVQPGGRDAEAAQAAPDELEVLRVDVREGRLGAGRGRCLPGVTRVWLDELQGSPPSAMVSAPLDFRSSIAPGQNRNPTPAPIRRATAAGR